MKAGKLFLVFLSLLFTATLQAAESEETTETATTSFQDQKPFKCDVAECDQAFAQKSNLSLSTANQSLFLHNEH